MSEKKLSKGEKKVIAAYDGDAKSTAKKCKLTYGYVRQILMFPYIKKVINAREAAELKKETAPLIADRKERQAFWSSVMRGDLQLIGMVPKLNKKGKPVVKKGKPVMEEVKEVPAMKNRLKASEALGRSNADFVDRLHVLDENKGVPQEITDDMEPKKATNIYLDLVKGRVAGNA